MKATGRIIERDQESLDRICAELWKIEYCSYLSYGKDGSLECIFLPCDLPRFKATMRELEQYGHITMEYKEE